MPVRSPPDLADRPTSPDGPGLHDYPVREYIQSMAVELAFMARDAGDPRLAKALDLAAELAAGRAGAG